MDNKLKKLLFIFKFIKTFLKTFQSDKKKKKKMFNSQTSTNLYKRKEVMSET